MAYSGYLLMAAIISIENHFSMLLKCEKWEKEGKAKLLSVYRHERFLMIQPQVS